MIRAGDERRDQRDDGTPRDVGAMVHGFLDSVEFFAAESFRRKALKNSVRIARAAVRLATLLDPPLPLTLGQPDRETMLPANERNRQQQWLQTQLVEPALVAH